MTFRFVAVAVGLFALLTLPVPVTAQDADTTAAQDTLEAGTDTTDARTDTTDVRAPSDTTMGPAARSDSAETAPDSVRMAPEERAKKQAQAAVSKWLEHVDAGDFGTSWDSAATRLQNSVPREEWIEQGEEARSNLRGLQSRALEHITYRDSVEQLPGGQPVVTMEYHSIFEGQSVWEAVVTTRQDAVWKVAGYRVVAPPAPGAEEDK